MSSIRIHWKAAANAAAYQVWRSTTNDSGTATLIADNVQGQHYVDSSVTAATTYYYWIKGKNSLGTGVFGPSSGPITAGPVLLPPKELTASLLTAGDVSLAWNAVAGATVYDVYRNTVENSGTASVIAANVAATSYVDTGTTGDTPYFYWVKAKDGSGNVSAFSTAALGFSALAVPAVPAGVSATDAETGQITVTWLAAARASSYRVFRNTTNNSATATEITEVAGLSFVDVSVALGTTYYYWIKARNYTGLSAFSASDTGQAVAAIPAAPTFVDATREVGKIVITAATSAGATSYSVWRSTTNDSGTATEIASGLATPYYEDSTVIPETTYYYWYKATNASGTSGFSLSDNAAAQISAPTGVAASSNVIGKSVVTWNAVTHRDSYEVWRNTVNNSGSATMIASGLTATTYDDTTVVKGQVYYYWVRAVKSSVPSPFSLSDPGETAVPAAPANVSATTTLSDRITVSWDAVPSASGYEIRYNTTNNFGSSLLLGTVGGAFLSIDHFGTPPGAVRYYWVIATVSGIQSDPSASASGYVAGTPAAPTGVTATDGLTGKVEVTWTLNGADTYSVYRNTTNTSAGSTLLASGVTGAFFEDAAVPSTGVYYYFVRAVVGGVFSGYSASDSGWAAQPTAPTGVLATDSDPAKITVTWSPVSGVDGYQVYRHTTNNFALATYLGLVFSESFEDSDPVIGTTYYYWVTTVKNLLESNPSTPDTGVRPLIPPAPPANVAATNGTGGDKITVTWDSVSGATGYEIWRATVNNSASASYLASVGAVTSYDDESPTDGTNYYYFMKSVNAAGAGSFSAGDMGYAVQPAQPSAPSTTNDNPNYVRVTWFASTYANHYSVWRNTVNNFATAVEIETNNTALTYDDVDAPFDQNLYYWIVPHNDLGAGTESPPTIGYSPSTLPAVPVLINQYGGTGIVVNQWNHAAFASDYEFIACYSNDIADVADQELMGYVTSHNWVAGVNGATFWVAIRAVNRAGVSAWTSLYSVYVY